jgi:DNA-binding MarR family transcriptional regulator
MFLSLEFYMWILIAVMLLAGSFGGLINYFLLLKNDPENASVPKSIIIGVGASFLVPLFLNMISSNLIESIKGTTEVPGDHSKLLVFAGFCLIAAISSTAFIQTLSDRILSEAKAARKQAAEAKIEAERAVDQVAQVQANVEPIIVRETEPEPSADSSVLRASADHLSEKERRILDAFARSRYSRRSANGLSRDTGIDARELDGLLAELDAKGFVGKRENQSGERWFITQEGLEAAVVFG